MRLQADLFPYPVLNPDLDDYSDNQAFDMALTTKAESSDLLSVNAVFMLRNSGLKQLINEGKAVFALHLEGRSSCYRILTTSKNNSITERINSTRICKKLECNGMIIAKKKLTYYTNEFNPLYYGTDYKIRELAKGSILAFLNTKEIDISLEARNGGGAESIFTVSAHDEPYMGVELNGDIIVVRLPQEIFKKYKNWGNTDRYRDFFIMTVFTPALAYVLERIEAREVDRELQWYSSLEQILDRQEINLDNESSLQIAQKLLAFPILKSGIPGIDKDDDDE